MSPTTPLTTTRRRLLMGAAALAPLVAVGGTAANAAQLGDFHNAAGLKMIDGSPWIHHDIRSVDFRVDTGGMVKTFPPSFRVTVPPSYTENSDRRYPVLLLLHGRGGLFLDWTKAGGVLEQTEKHEVIVVMPDGGAGSFYSNANFPLPGREAAWESFIMTQVLPFVHENFRTRPDSMAIGGLSMGGWGALALGQRYWGHFRSVSSYSGPADCSDRHPDSTLVGGAIWICPAFDAEKYFGTSNLPGATWGHDWYPQIARGYNPIDNIDKYKGKRVFLRTGDGPWGDFFDGLFDNPDLLATFKEKLGEVGADFIENIVHPNQERFAGELAAAGIDHDFQVVRGATHEWGLWRDNLAEDLPGMMKVLNA
ncbi:alpha/beta hydrolase family protein [Brachybacterium sp. UMB0905]|uniref:alpha/beta hydrolase n=1 Tax=Brachybacterium sp. UMB0905 TaxID=2069310 RepID=UPI000C7F898C|nr:alpha/beta hydrolase-fold protein [Brachybacterium sp. UMB0905]PMC76932.1 hypothetical protein CJ197_01070 [Brachybacterium sp. UMB0905]